MPEIVEPQVTQATPPASIAYLFLQPFYSSTWILFFAGKQQAEDLLKASFLQATTQDKPKVKVLLLILTHFL